MFEGAPDLAVEVLSPSNRAGAIRDKVADYLAAGCSLVWVVDPRRRRVSVHEPGKATSFLEIPDTLDGAPVLPGFRLALVDLFGE
jgi:Uma2 family endonuclease